MKHYPYWLTGLLAYWLTGCSPTHENKVPAICNQHSILNTPENQIKNILKENPDVIFTNMQNDLYFLIKFKSQLSIIAEDIEKEFSEEAKRLTREKKNKGLFNSLGLYYKILNEISANRRTQLTWERTNSLDHEHYMKINEKKESLAAKYITIFETLHYDDRKKENLELQKFFINNFFNFMLSPKGIEIVQLLESYFVEKIDNFNKKNTIAVDSSDNSINPAYSNITFSLKDFKEYITQFKNNELQDIKQYNKIMLLIVSLFILSSEQ